MNPLIQLQKTTLIFLVSGLCYGLLPKVQAVSPDGCLPGGNTAEGCNALLSLTTGRFNTAVGFDSLLSNTNTDFNTGVGAGALLLNTSNENTATGAGALFSNTTGGTNTANGAFALFSNTTGAANTAGGAHALFSNTEGNGNTANGFGALNSNTTGPENTAIGHFILFDNTVGGANTATGFTALENNTTGGNNTAVGAHALQGSLSGDLNTALGWNAGSGVITASSVICIGTDGADVSNTTWIGNVFGVTTQNGTTAPVIVSDGGQLGTVASSERFKKDIATMDKASDAILSLRPVTFHYKTDTKGAPQFGLIAEEVAKVNSSLVIPDKEGKPFTVRYDAVNVMLLNEFLKEHRKVEQLQKQIEALTAGLQKVRAQIEASKPVAQVAQNNQ